MVMVVVGCSGSFGRGDMVMMVVMVVRCGCSFCGGGEMWW